MITRAYLALLVVAAAAARLLAADAAPADAGSPSLEFRRIYAPLDRINDWPIGTARYLPLDSTEFQQLLEAVQSGASVPPESTVKLARADYRAAWTDDGALVGQATFEVIYASNRPALLPLDPCNLAITSADWTSGKIGKATLGQGPDGKLGVLVERSGSLRLTWSLTGKRTAIGATSYSIAVPSTPLSQLIVDVPPKWIAATDTGLLDLTAGAGVDKRDRWRVELGGRGRFNLRILSDEAAAERRQFTLLRQALTYQFLPQGLDVTAQLRLDIHSEPVDRLVVDLDPTLELVSARYGETEVPWSAEPSGDKTRVTLLFREPLTGIGRVIRLSAIAPANLSKPWALPSMRPEGVLWQEGAATLLVPSPLVLERIDTHECRQARTSPLPAPLAGDSFEVQCYSPAAQIEVVVARPRDLFRATTRTSLGVGPSETIAQMDAELSINQGERFVVRADLHPKWTIKSVDSDTADLVSSWETPVEDGTRRLIVRLARAVSPSRQVRLHIVGRRPMKAAEHLTLADIAMLSLSQTKVERQVIALGPAEGHDLSFSGDEDLRLIDSQELDQLPASIFAGARPALAFAVDPAASALEVTANPVAPRFTADVQIDLAAQGKSLTESYLFRCTPGTQRLDRIVVQFSVASKRPLEWSLAGRATGRLTARRIVRKAAARAAPAGEEWEVALRSARNEPFEVRAVRTVPLAKDHRVALAALAGASRQTGTLTVRAIGETEVTVKAAALPVSPPELLAADRQQTVRATYRFDPARDLLAEVTVSRALLEQYASGAWAWSAELTSLYAAGEAAIHTCRFRIQTGGRSLLRMTMPPGCQSRAIYVDSERTHTADSSSPIDVRLPSGRSVASVAVEFISDETLPTYRSAVNSLFPRLDVPVLDRHWTVWLPAGFEVEDGDPRWLSHRSVDPGWKKRLFGPLARAGSQRPFNPLRPVNWQLPGQADTTSQGEVDRLLTALRAALAHPTAGDVQATWGRFLANIETAAGRTAPAWLVDRVGLAHVGIGPNTPLPALPPEGDLAALMDDIGLVVIEHPRGLILASSTTAACYHDQLSQLDAPFTYAVMQGPLKNDLTRVFERGGSAAFETAARWRLEPVPTLAAWPIVAGPSQGVDSRCWTAYHAGAARGEAATVHIVRTSAWWTLAWALFFVGLAAGLSQGRRGLSGWLVSLAAAAALVLVVPASFTTLLSACMLGLLCALGYHVVLRRSAEPVERAAPAATLAMVQPVTTVLLLCLLSACAPEVLAAEPFNRNPLLRGIDPATRVQPADKAPAAAAASAPAIPRPATGAVAKPVYKVFVPVDDKQRPTGKSYLPEEFFNDLHRRAARLSRQPQRWLITAARYRGVLSRESVQRKIVLSELRASFDLQVVYPNVRVRMPLGRRGLVAAPQTVRLEGEPVKIEWEPAGDAFAVTVLEPGFYRLEIALQPAMQAAPAASGIEIDIPRVSDSSLELTVPQDGPSLELPSSRGRRQYDPATGKLTADLGPTSRLAVRWQEGTRIAEGSQVTEAEELLWLKVQPGSLVVDARFKLRASEGRLRRLRLLVDPRLRLLPSATADPTIAAVHMTGGDPQTLEVDLHPSTGDTLVVNLSFLLSGTSGVGNVRPPRLESLDTRVTRRWIALSIDPSLQFAKQADANLRSVAAPDFAAAWGTAEAPPQIAYDVPRGELAWVLATQAPEPTTSVDQVLTLGVGRGLADVRYQAAFDTQAGYHLQLHVAAPPELEVDSIALSENGVQRVVRWSRQSAGPITVFLSAPVTGRQRLELRGRIGFDDRGRLEAPNIRLAGATLKSQLVKVFRRPAALVEVEPNEAVQRTEMPIDEQEKAEFGSFLGSFRLSGAPLRLHVTPNAPTVDAVEVISLDRKDEGWEAEVDVNLRSRHGVLDTLHFDIPPDWTEPLVASDQSVCHVISSPDLARRQLVVRPPAPIKDRYRVKIRGRILLPQGERLRVPDVTLRGASHLQRFIVLPLQLELQEVGWDIAGLKPARLPADFRALPVSPEAFAAYQVSAPRFEATLRPTEAAPTGAHVLLADIAASWRSDGRVYGMAAFDYVPGGKTSCDLLLPADYRLVHVSVAGLSGHAQLVHGRWRLRLVSADLPQRIFIVFDGSLQGGGWRQRQARIALPQIAQVPTRRTLLTIDAPPLAGDGQASDAASSSPQQHQIARLQATVDALELAEQAARTLAPDELLRWRRPWLRRHSLLRQEVTRWLEAAAIPDQRLQDQLRALLDRGNTLGVDEASLVSGSASDPLPMELGQLPDAEVPGDTAAPCYASFEQGRSSVLVVYPGAARSDLAERLVAALGIVSIAVAGGVAVRGRSLPKIPPRAALVAFGLLWWLFFEPSGVGLAAAVIGLISWLLRNRKPSQQLSTIRRLRV